MIRLANVLIVDSDHDRAEDLQRRLSHNGFHAAIAEDSENGLHAAQVEHPDLIMAIQPLDCDPVDFGRRVKATPEITDIPVVVAAEPVTAELCFRAFDAGLDDVIPTECGEVELIARLRPLCRLATMHSELKQRAAIARSCGIHARERVDAPYSMRPIVLVIGDDCGTVQQVLAGDAELTVTENLFEAEDLLTRTNYDAAVLSFKTDPEGLLGFCTQVRNNPRLFNLPLVLLDDAVDGEDAYRRGVTRLITRPADPIILRTAVLTLVRRQQLRWSIRAALGDSLKEAGRDAVTGAYSRGFFDAYIEGRLSVAQQRDRHLSLVFFSAPAVGSVRTQFGDDAALHLSQQLAQWIGGLLRAEDMTAAYAEHEFCVVLPDTPLVEAEVVMHRIAGVLAYTDFAVREVYQPVKVWVQVGATDAWAEDDVQSMLARARLNID